MGTTDKKSLVNWLITNDVDMTNSRIQLPSGWRWSRHKTEGFYCVIGATKNVATIVTMQDVALEIMNRLRRGNVRYDRLIRNQ